MTYHCSHSPESGEREYVEEIERWCGIDTTWLDMPPHETFSSMGGGGYPYSPSHAYVAQADLMQTTDSTVLLSGELGDLVMAKNSQHSVSMLEHVQALRFRRFVQDILLWSHRRRRPLHHVMRPLATALLPHAWSERLARRQLKVSAASILGTSTRSLAAAYALRPDFLARVGFRPFDPGSELARFSRTKRSLVRGLLRWLDSGSLMTSDDLTTITVSYPYTHRPLIEFVAAVPESVLWEAGCTRALMRRSLVGVLPDKVLGRVNKGDAAPALSRLLRPLVIDMSQSIESCHLVQRGYMEPAPLARQLTGLLNTSLGNAGYVARLVAVEAWLRTHERGSHATRTETGEAAVPARAITAALAGR